MKKHVKTMTGILMAVTMSTGLTAFAAEDVNIDSASQVTNDNGGITPYFLAISDCSRALTLESSDGLLYCGADTAVYSGYTAYVKVELQRYNSGWGTIKTWNDKSSDDYAYITKNYYVTNGRYRLKVTHRAYKGSTIADEFIAYSNEVTY